MIYEYACAVCDKGWEAIHSIEDRHTEKCKQCGNKALLLITNTAKPQVMDYYSENLDAHITGPRQKKRIMREKNLEEVK